MKQALLDRFSAYLDTAEEAEAPEQETDLYSLFVELAGLRSEVRTESRLVKEALDQFRSVFDALQASQGTVQQELARARAQADSQARAAMRPLLLELIDLRDRLLAALKLAGDARPGWVERLLRRPAAASTSWQEGLRLTLRRLDQVLADRRVVPLALLGQKFDPQRARAIGTAPAGAGAEGIVIEEVRTGFLWDDQVLRTADVIVSKRADGKGEAA